MRIAFYGSVSRWRHRVARFALETIHSFIQAWARSTEDLIEMSEPPKKSAWSQEHLSTAIALLFVAELRSTKS
jgi:hypothetical protein